MKQVAIVLSIVLFIFVNSYLIYVREMYTVGDINNVVLALLVIMLAYNFFRYGSLSNPEKKTKTKHSYYEVIPEKNDV